MRYSGRPSISFQDTLNVCAEGIGLLSLRARLRAQLPALQSQADDYVLKAEQRELYQIPPNPCEPGELLVGTLTKAELQKCYTRYLRLPEKPGRKIYEAILASAPARRCPYCGFGHARTLDHYLPESVFPQFSVLPDNLVPACGDCNHGKLDHVPSLAHEQLLHPHFDRTEIADEQWLFARVVPSTPATIEYFVSPPLTWEAFTSARVTKHMEMLSLNTRYAVEAADELATLKIILANLSSVEDVQSHLHEMAQAHYHRFKNSWKTALYQGLAASAWYCSGGYLEV